MKLTIVLTILLTSYASHARTGNESGGGGPGIFCPASVTDQPSVQLLDIFEARVEEPALVVPETSIPYEIQLQGIIQKLGFDKGFQYEFLTGLDYLKKHSVFLPKGISIQVPPDLGEDNAVLLPTGCTLGAIGYYESNGTLKISKDAFEDLSETQKAAFWAHETFYLIIRKARYSQGKINVGSRSARKLVGYSFSESPLWQQLYYLSSEFGRKYNGYLEDEIQRSSRAWNLTRQEIKANDLIKFSLQIFGSTGVDPKGIVQCTDVNGDNLTEVQLREQKSSLEPQTVNYFATVPADCKMIVFRGINNTYSGLPYHHSFNFKIYIGKEYATPRGIHYDVHFASGSQVDFNIRYPVFPQTH